MYRRYVSPNQANLIRPADGNAGGVLFVVTLVYLPGAIQSFDWVEASR